MAKVKFGMFMTDARGKVGGHILSKNRGGSFVRTKVTPANPRTASQAQARARLANNSSAWSALTEAQRVKWNEAVVSYQKTDVFGDLRKPTGKNLFTGLNANLQLVNSSPIVAPENPVALIDPVELAFVDLSSGSIEIANFPEVTDQKYVIMASPAMSPGTFNFSGKLKVIKVTPGTATTMDVATEYIAKFGAFIPGQKIAIKMFVVSTVTGQKSSGVVISQIVAG